MKILIHNNKPIHFNNKLVNIDRPWQPLQLQNLVAWWDMSDTTKIVESSNSVSQVQDKSGNDYHMSQSNGSYQPLTGTRSLNGLNVIEFDTSNWLEHTDSASTIFPINTDINVFTVASRDISSSNDMFFYVKDGPAGVVASTGVYDGLGSGGADVLECVMMYDDFVDNCRQTFQDSSNYFSINPNAEEENLAQGGDTPIFISRFERGSGTKYMKRWVNGSVMREAVINSGQNGNVATTLVLGGHGSLGSASRRLDGYISEIVITHGDLSDDELYKMEGYLAHKWGITSLLPSDHPYKTLRPEK